MTTLHMKTEEVRNAAHQLDLAIGDLYLKPGKLKGAASSLRSAWQGGKSNYYANQLQQMGNLLHEEVINLQRLVKRMYQEVDQWEDADSDHAFRSLGLLPAGAIGTGIFTSTFIASSNGNVIEPFDWYKFGRDAGKEISGDIVEVLGDTKLRTYHNWGKQLNDFVGNPKGGYIGKLENAGRLIKSNVFQTWIAPIGIGAAFDMMEGENFAQAVISTGISVGAVEAAKYMIPAVGPIMIVNGGVQIVGNLVSAGLEMSGDHYGAALLQNGMESIDLGGYVDDLSDAVTDMILPPWNDPPDFSKIGERAKKIDNLGKFIPYMFDKLM